ncbi:hypothetical protein ACTXT7_003959 [Hymenolepis weldensis]
MLTLFQPKHQLGIIKQRKLYDPKLIRVHYGWPIFLNWAAVGVFIAAAGAWFKLKQVLHVEASRAMI